MTGIEIQILDFIQQIRTTWLDYSMIFVTTLGNAGILWIGIGIVLLCSKKHKKTGIMILTALAVEVVLCNGILKHIVARVRPCDINNSIQLLIARPTDYSFPSGHTGAAFAAVSMLYMRKEKGRYVALLLASLIAFSRMYLYVHYPTDILGGIIVGIVSAWIVYISFKFFENKCRKNNKTTV